MSISPQKFADKDIHELLIQRFKFMKVSIFKKGGFLLDKVNRLHQKINTNLKTCISFFVLGEIPKQMK